jgi:hypothetical protein
LRATTRRFTSEVASLLDRYSFDPTDGAAKPLSPWTVDSAVAALTVGRHRSGAFDTPPAVAAFMCRAAIDGCVNGRAGNDTVADLKFVDPAVGCGAFLVELLDRPNGLSHHRAEDKPCSAHDIAGCLYGADVDADAVHVARLRIWLRQAATSDEPPDWPDIARRIVVGDSLLGIDWPAVFPEVFAAERGGFDAVLANPPYLRQELIEPRTKTRLRAAFPLGASGFSDLCCYFYLLGLRLLRPGGMHVFVGTNSWLDTRYGAKLRSHLAAEATIESVYETATARQFAADVNTLITVLRKGPPPPGHQARFVSVTAGHRQDASGTRRNRSRRRETLVPQARLLAVATKWGGKYLRSADIGDVILNKAASKLVPLRALAEVRPGCYSGINDFFYLSAADAKRWRIEPQLLLPLVRSPRDVPYLDLDAAPAAPADFVFCCGLSKDELRRHGWQGALDYIAWGERQRTRRRQKTAAGIRWPRTESVRNRKPGWWAIPPQNVRPARNFLLYVVCGRFLAPWTSQARASDRCFHRIFVAEEMTLPLAAVLNSTLTMLFICRGGRANLGQGALKFEAADAKELFVLDPRRLVGSDWQAALAALGARPVRAAPEELSSPDRRALDEIIFDSLGLQRAERDGVYESVREMVRSRLARAASRGLTSPCPPSCSASRRTRKCSPSP